MDIPELSPVPPRILWMSQEGVWQNWTSLALVTSPRIPIALEYPQPQNTSLIIRLSLIPSSINRSMHLATSHPHQGHPQHAGMFLGKVVAVLGKLVTLTRDIPGMPGCSQERLWQCWASQSPSLGTSPACRDVPRKGCSSAGQVSHPYQGHPRHAGMFLGKVVAVLGKLVTLTRDIPSMPGCSQERLQQCWASQSPSLGSSPACRDVPRKGCSSAGQVSHPYQGHPQHAGMFLGKVVAVLGKLVTLTRVIPGMPGCSQERLWQCWASQSPLPGSSPACRDVPRKGCGSAGQVSHPYQGHPRHAGMFLGKVVAVLGKLVTLTKGHPRHAGMFLERQDMNFHISHHIKKNRNFF